jgi:translocation and assembly module TamB
MVWSSTLTDAHFGGLTLDRLVARGGYAERRADLTLDLFRDGHPVLSARGRLPLDLSLTPVGRRVLEDDPLVASVRSDSTDLSLLEALTPAVQRASGRLEARVDVAGTWKRPRFTGMFTIGDGTMFLPKLGMRFDRVNADVALSGDSVAIRKAEASTAGQRSGRATLTGAVTFNELANPTLDLRIEARNFHVIDVPRVADLELSTVAGNPLHLAGSAHGSVLTGGVAVSYGNIRIPDIAGQKKVVSLDDPELDQVVDTSLFTNRTLLPDAPPEFVRNLTMRDVQIDMGSDTWLRSSEANVNLGGSVRVTTSRNARDPEKVQLALDGPLRAERGTYRLNLGVVQRTFTIEGGTLRFYGTDPDLNPTLDITALHVVRPFGQAASQTQREIPIRVKIGGTLAQPTLTLSSDDTRLQQSDLLSYLITGQPSFEVGTAQTQSIVQLVLPSVTSYLESRFSGGLFDYVQIQSAGLGPQAAGSSTQLAFGSLLGNTRLGLGWQIGSRTFVSLNVGLCQFGRVVGGGAQAQFSAEDLARSAGGRVEYQIDPRRGLSGALSLEPATNQVYQCQQTTSRSFVQTPYQLGFDLFKRWQF